MNPWQEELDGIPVFVNENVPVGRPIYSAFSAGETIVLHPLDLIAVQWAGDALGRLDAVKEYFIARAHRELDALAERLCVAQPDELSPNLRIAQARYEDEMARTGAVRDEMKATWTITDEALARAMSEPSEPAANGWTARARRRELRAIAGFLARLGVGWER